MNQSEKHRVARQYFLQNVRKAIESIPSEISATSITESMIATTLLSEGIKIMLAYSTKEEIKNAINIIINNEVEL